MDEMELEQAVKRFFESFSEFSPLTQAQVLGYLQGLAAKV